MMWEICKLLKLLTFTTSTSKLVYWCPQRNGFGTYQLDYFDRFAEQDNQTASLCRHVFKAEVLFGQNLICSFNRNFVRPVVAGLKVNKIKWENRALIGVLMIKIAQTMKQLLKERGMTLRELSKRSGVPVSTLSEWSSNREPKSPTQTRKVAQALGVSMHYLLFGEDDSQEPLQKLLKEDLFQGTFEITVKKVRMK
jgi:transcriptional regulator with XRE-family HTH domain